MTAAVLYKLLAIFCTVALGWAAGRMRWLGPMPQAGATDPSRVLGNAAFYIFVPALLFRTTARLDPSTLPWSTLLAFFVPALGVLFATYGVYRWRLRRLPPLPGGDLPAAERRAAIPATHAVSAVFGNSLQVGIPLAAGVFGEAGLGIHIAVISLHALVLLSTLTVLVELDISRARALHEGTAGMWRTLRSTVRNTQIHPVVLPVLAGMLWHLTGWRLPGPLDETLALLGTAVAPLCLVLIGLSLAYTRTSHLGVALRPALVSALLKLLLLPAVVLAVAHGLLGLSGLPLGVVVMMAALPTGSNALIFAQRYRTVETETSTAIVLSTLAFVLSAPAWLAVLGAMGVLAR